MDPEFGTRVGGYFENYLADEAKALEITVAEAMAWKPPVKSPGGEKRRRRKGA